MTLEHNNVDRCRNVNFRNRYTATI